jgi:hypothetical protein
MSKTRSRNHLFSSQTSFPLSLRIGKPEYFSDDWQHLHGDPIFIGLDSLSVNVIQSRKGRCLLCDQASYRYDFNFCFSREVWVLYSQHSQLCAAIDLGRAIQKSGARKVCVILLSSHLQKRTIHDVKC